MKLVGSCTGCGTATNDYAGVQNPHDPAPCGGAEARNEGMNKTAKRTLCHGRKERQREPHMLEIGFVHGARMVDEKTSQYHFCRDRFYCSNAAKASAMRVSAVLAAAMVPPMVRKPWIMSAKYSVSTGTPASASFMA